MKALVTGATGFIGSALVAKLDHPVVLTRDPARARERLGPAVTPFAWDPMSGPPPAEAFTGVEAVFHLAGENVGGGRWTKKRKAAIRESRLVGTRNLVEGIRTLAVRPRVLVSASAVGYYGDRADETLDERAAPGTDFLADVCVAWEVEARAAGALGVRVVTPRFGVVLGPGGALAKMLTPFKLGLGGRLGSGNQWMPWIHRDDVVGMMLFAASNADLSGPMNAVAPAPVTNREFTKALGAALGRWTIFPMPGFMLKIVVGEFATVLLGSQRVVPGVATAKKYVYMHPDLAGALRKSLSENP
jgi:uncharacterized protein (TIGR01777 family)